MIKKKLSKRLAKVATEFNQSMDTVLEFLKTKGIIVERNPNVKLSDDLYKLLEDEFLEDRKLKVKAEEELWRLKREVMLYPINKKNTFFEICIGSILESKVVSKSEPNKLIFILENGMIGYLPLSQLNWNYGLAKTDFMNIHIGTTLKFRVHRYDDETNEFVLDRTFGKKTPIELTAWKDLELWKGIDAVVFDNLENKVIIKLGEKLFGTMPLENILELGTIIKVIPIFKNEGNFIIECVQYNIDDKLYYLTQGKYKNKEHLGNLHFEKGISDLLNRDFNQAYEELIKGLYTSSCDCTLSKLILKYRYDIQILFVQDFLVNCSINKLDFLRAIYYFFINNYEKALILIDLFIIDSYDEIGHYFKGRILAGLNKYNEAIEELESVNSEYGRTPRMNYRIGRIKEEHLGQNGLEYLWRSVIDNPTSICAQRWLKESVGKHKIRLSKNPEDLLVNKFNSSDTEDYLITLNQFLEFGFIDLEDDSRILADVELPKFIESLHADKSLFGVYDNDFDDDKDNLRYYDEMDNSNENYDDYYKRAAFDYLTDGTDSNYDDWNGDISDLKEGLGLG